MEVEHWVDLDPFHTSIVNPVLGVEQLLDVELDRHTELLPIRRNDPISRKRRGEDHTKGGEDIAIGQNELDDPCKPIAFCVVNVSLHNSCRLRGETQITSSTVSYDHER